MKRLPRKAFVLAAGFGERMLPLTRELPKPMLPLWGRPMLEHTLRLLRDWGVEEALINVHHLPGPILEFARRNPVPGLALNLSHEPDILGTGGALRRAEWFLDEDPFWLINADVAADVDPHEFVRTHRKLQCLATLWMHPSLGPRTVEMNNGLVANFTSAKPGSPGTYTFCGLHLLSPRILDFLPQSGFAGIIPAYNEAMRRGERISGVCPTNAFWADIGTPEQYLLAHDDVLRLRNRLLPSDARARTARAKRAGAKVRGFAAFGADVEIECGAVVADSVICDGARLSAAAQCEKAIVGPGIDVGRRVSNIVMNAAQAMDDVETAAARAVGIDVRLATLQQLAPRGSARSYSRLVQPCGKPLAAIVMRYDPAREENRLFCGHARFLAQIGLRVPAILYESASDRLILLEDLGDRSLQDAAAGASRSALMPLYRLVIDQVALLHTKGTAQARRRRIRLMPPFTPELYRWEHRLFAENMLLGRLGMRKREVDRVLAELETVARGLESRERVLLHRDLQSSNILLPVRGAPAFIDFQGMRFGPAEYDMASLLCDPYVSLDEEAQNELLDYYWNKRNASADQRLFRSASIQRLTQALGAFARLSCLPGMRAFERHIAPAASMLLRVLGRTDALNKLREVALFLAQQHVTGSCSSTPASTQTSGPAGI